MVHEISEGLLVSSQLKPWRERGRKEGEERGVERRQTRWRTSRIHSPKITPSKEVLVSRVSTPSQRLSTDGLRTLKINPFPKVPILNVASLGTKPSIHELLESHQIQTLYSYALGACYYMCSWTFRGCP